MREVYKELDEVKSELEKLKEECRTKTELSESLKRAHSDSQVKCQEAKSQIEKQAKELNVKSEEVAELRRLYEEVKSKLQETETSLKQATYVREKIRMDCGEKVQRLEGENRKLVAALEEATGRNDDMERKVRACNEEIEVLKACLSETQRKCTEAEEKARVGKELRNREDVIMKLEEQSMSVQDQLKWKKEQFQHLEEAHKRLQDQFQLKTKEWASEKAAMLEEITTLQSKLDSQIRISESLESRLKMCNQALAHEESRRKLLDVQLSESKQCFENVLAEYEEAKAKIESLSSKRAEDIACLRNSLGIKEVMLKEMEYKVTHLEQENKELLGNVKELQEAQISKRRVDPLINKLRNKFKDLEQAHSKCSLTLMEKEAEWNSKMVQLIGDLKSKESDLNRKSEQMNQLKMQLDDCQSAMEASKDETSILFMVLKAELSVAYCKLFDLEAQNEKVSADQMDTKDCFKLKPEVCLRQAREEIAALKQKLKSLKLLEEHSNRLEDALGHHKKMLEESVSCQIHFEEQVSQMQDSLNIASAALEKSKSDLAAKINEASQVEVELQLWKSKAESFRTCLEQSQEACNKMERSMLEQVETEKGLRKENKSFQLKLEDQGQTIDHLQQKIASLNQILEKKEAAAEEIETEVVKALEKEESLHQMLKQRDTEIKSLKKDLKAREDQHMRNATAVAELQQKIASLNQILEQHKAATKEMKEDMVKALKKEENLVKRLKERDTAVETLRNELQAVEEQSVGRATAAADSAKLEAQTKYECEREELRRSIKEREETLTNIRKELEALKEQSVIQATAASESARLEAESKFELEKEEMCRIIATERDEKMIQHRELTSLKQDFMNVSVFTLSQEVENLVQIVALQEALRISEFNLNAQIESKNKAIDILEMEVKTQHDKISFQEECLHHSNQSVQELEALAEAKKLEMEKLVNEFREQQTKLKEQTKEFEIQKEAATECVNRLISERETLLMYIDGINEQIGDFCIQGVEFDGFLEKLSLNFVNSDALISGDISSDRVSDFVQKHQKEIEPCLTRSPLKERNK